MRLVARVTRLALGLLCFVALSGVGSAEQPTVAEKPFAEHRLALQLSDNDVRKQGMLLSVANNMLSIYGPDKIAIEVVTFGPGIELLKVDNANRTRVESLMSQGVQYDVCLKTLETIERETGKRPTMHPNAVSVRAGVEQIIKLTESGYTLVRP